MALTGLISGRRMAANFCLEHFTFPDCNLQVLVHGRFADLEGNVSLSFEGEVREPLSAQRIHEAICLNRPMWTDLNGSTQNTSCYDRRAPKFLSYCLCR